MWGLMFPDPSLTYKALASADIDARHGPIKTDLQTVQNKSSALMLIESCSQGPWPANFRRPLTACRAPGSRPRGESCNAWACQ